MPLGPGDRLGGYEILSTIGSGGMGVVYRARDARLGRIVAIKLPVRDTDTDENRRRLIREAQHASALNHPNICTIFEVDESDGRLFVVLEFVDGETLSARIAKRSLTLDVVVNVAQQVLEALAHAHTHGIVHRDLKPGNVVINRDGRAKVLDFGLSRRTWHEGAAYAATVPMTHSGAIAGTIAYLAPEVLRGAPGDARNDIWAFGVMLFEMIAGGSPFGNGTEFEVSSRILNESPASLPRDVPAWLGRIVSGSLKKNPDERYQSIDDVRRAFGEVEATRKLRRIAAVGLASARSRIAIGAMAMVSLLAVANRFLTVPVLATASVAVVPFASDGIAPDDEYVSEGIIEGVIEKLTRVPRANLKVISLNSVRQYNARDIDPTIVGKALHVSAVLLGRLAQHEDKLWVSAELVNAMDRTRLWGKSFTGTVADLPTVQTEIAENVSAALKTGLTNEEKQRIAKSGTDNVEAYRLFLKGRYHANKYSEEGWKRSVDYFKQAIELDPTYASAWSGLSDAYYGLSSLALAPEDVIPLARAAAIKALAIDDSLADAHSSLGVIKEQYDWDSVGAERELKRALELNPNYAPAHNSYGVHLYVNGRFDSALAELAKARELDPLSMFVVASTVWPLPYIGREDDVVPELEKIITSFPEVPILVEWLHQARGEAYLRKGLDDQAVAELVQGWKVSMLCGSDSQAAEALKQAYATSGLTGYWRKQLELAVARYRQQVIEARDQSSHRYVSTIRLAELYAQNGDKEQAFALLRNAYEHRDENLRFLKVESMRVESAWTILRTDPRFEQLLRGMGLAN